MINGIRTIIDLSSLPAPDVIETIDFEVIYDQNVASFIDLWNAARAADASLPAFTAQNLESDPVAAIFQAWAYREMLLRARVNDAARSNLLAFATKNDLDHIGFTFGVERMVIEPDTATTAAVMETDERYRNRIQLGIYAFNSAGSIESYLFHALSASPLVKDVAVDNPHTSRIDVTVLSADGDGAASDDLLVAVAARLSPETSRPLTDDVRLRSAQIVAQAVVVKIVLPAGPAPEPIRLLAQEKVAAYCAARHKIGRALRIDGIVGAARTAGDIEQVIVEAPLTDVLPTVSGAVFVPSVTVNAEILP